MPEGDSEFEPSDSEVINKKIKKYYLFIKKLKIFIVRRKWKWV